MVSTTVHKKVDSNIQGIRVSHVEDVTKQLLEDSINTALEKVSRYNRNKSLEDLFQDFYFFEQFNYCLSTKIAEMLAQNDERIQAVYQFGESMNPGSESGEYPPIDPCVHLLCLVEKSSAGLEAYIDGLDRALTKEMRDLPASCYAKLSSVLDICIVTEEDVENRKGYASLLKSLHAPPLCVWRRD